MLFCIWVPLRSADASAGLASRLPTCAPGSTNRDDSLNSIKRTFLFSRQRWNLNCIIRRTDQQFSVANSLEFQPFGSNKSRELNIFPLHDSVIFPIPGSDLPLHIYEPRYRTMFSEVLDDDKHFGVTLLDTKNGGIASIGVDMLVTQSETLEDGRILLNSECQSRFRILEIIQEEPFVKARVEGLQDNKPVTQEDRDAINLADAQVMAIMHDLYRYASKLHGDKEAQLYTQLHNMASSMQPSVRWNILPYTVARVLEIPVSDQQHMLEMRDPAGRLQLSRDALQSALKFLYAKVALNDSLNPNPNPNPPQDS